MAGGGIALEGMDKIQRELARLASRTSNLEPALRDMGEELLQSTDQHFEKGENAEGKQWKALKEQTLKRKLASSRSRTRTLEDSGTLRDTIRHQTTADTLEVGTDRVYGATHQFGDKARNIPARPFLGLSEEDKQKLERIVAKHLGR